MKHFRYLLYLSLFFAFLLAGLWAGRRTRPALFTMLPETLAQTRNARAGETRPGESSPANLIERLPSPTATAVQPASLPQPAEPPAIPIQRTPALSQQHNLLLLGTDDLAGSAPSLESVWVAMYFPDVAHITLMPVYPPPQSSLPSSIAPGLPTFFRLTPDGTPDTAFFAQLQARGLWWTDYILLDETGLLTLIDLANALSDQSLDGIAALSSLSPSANNPAAAHMAQLTLLQQLCRLASRSSAQDSAKINALYLLHPRHVVTNLSLEDALLEWEGLFRQGGGLICEFPALATAQNRP